MDRKIKSLDLFSQRGRPSIHIRPTNVNIVEGQSHIITCSISSISDITDITWIKVTAVGYEIVDVVGVDGKFSGGTLSDPSLTINNIVKSDEGTYVCRATNCFGTASSKYSVLTFKECIEVEIIQKGPITVGYGGTIRINAKIISNSTGSLKVNWQKTHDNCSTNLMINCLKYSGSSCNVNNPELVINNVDIEDAGIYKLEVTSTTETISSPEILLELYGDEADSLSKERNNFVRLYFLCQKIATQAVRNFFDSNVPGLESFLQQHKSALTSKKNVYKCTVEQTAILFPGNQVTVDSADFDFTLLYKLIRNLLTTITAPISGWGNPPLPQHLNETDDIERIRGLRNKLTHNSEFEICGTDFSTHWTDLSQVINRLSKGSLSTDVESMRTKKFDKCTKNEMEEDIRKELKEIQAELMELQQDVTECHTDIADNRQNIADNKQNIADNKQDIADNKQEIHNINTSHIPLHIKKGHAALIDKWRKDDDLFYDKTEGFTATLKMVMAERYMTIIGGPGSGKTATARHIALQLEEQGWEVVPVCELKDIINYGDIDHKQVFVLDDVLGIFAVKMNNIMNHQENIITAIGETSKLLFTCRKSVYKEGIKHGFFVTRNAVDLQSNELTETEKMAICQYHCEAKGVNRDLYTSLSFTKANHMFPLLCKLFSMQEKYQQLGESFFNKPFEYFNIELDKLQLSGNNTIQYAVLVWCLVNEGKFSVERLSHESKQDVFNNCGVNLGTPDKQVIDAIYHMSETYFTKLDTEYTFTHDFIYEAIAYHYGSQSQNQQQILKYLPSSYIANKVTVCEQASNEDHCIQISEDMYLPLAERLYKDIQSMNLFDVFMNKSLLHRPFLDVFEGMLKRKPFDEFELLILRNIRRKTLPFKKHIQKLCDNTAYQRLELLFDVKYHEKSGIEYNFRVICWIINYGHTHLLQEIVNHVKCNNHRISLIFGSNVMENTHLLVLGCYTNTLDMVELILKYVDPKCINMNLMSCGTSSNIMPAPLTVVCETGSLHILKALLEKHADINKCDDWKRSPLYVASWHGHCEVVKCLLSSGADINLVDEGGKSPLFVSSKCGECDVVKCLLSSGADINLCENDDGQSPLLIALYYGHIEVVKYLLSSGADINLCDAGGHSPLFTASMGGYCDVVEYLLSSGADINLCDADGKSPLFMASMGGYYDVVECLLSSVADINLCDEQRRSPLFIASEEGRCDVVKCLLSSGADIYLCDENGQSPFFIASEKGRCDVVKCLLSSGVDINLCDADGQSPLFTASMGGYCDVVKCLISSGAEINLCDEQGRSPLFIASKEGRCDVVKCLLSSGADINLCDENGQSPLVIASEKGRCDVVKCLL